MSRFVYIRRAMSVVCMLLSMLVLLPAQAGSYEDYFKAVKLDDARTVENLLRRGFDPNTVEEERGDSGLILALRENSMEVVKVLMKSPDINLEARSGNGDNALMIAAYKANRAAVDMLLAKDVAVNRDGWTPLHYAAASGDTAIAQLLMNRKADLDARSPNGTTPMMMAARGGYIWMVKLLLDAGADATLKNERGMTAIDFAQEGNYTDIVEGLTYRLKRAGKL